MPMGKQGPMMLWLGAALVAAGVLLAGCGERPLARPAAGQRTPSVTASMPADNSVTTGAALLGRGINLGNALEAPREGEWGVVLEEEFFDLIADAGSTAYACRFAGTLTPIPRRRTPSRRAFFGGSTGWLRRPWRAISGW